MSTKKSQRTERWRAKRKACGGCTMCSRKAATGRKKCRKHLKARRAYMLRHRNTPKNKARRRRWNARRQRDLKAKVIKGYGGKCACCGEHLPDFLTLDHKHNDGAAHRKTGICTTTLYVWLIRNGFPKARFQLLCMNCNWAKGVFGRCPHRRKAK